MTIRTSWSQGTCVKTGEEAGRSARSFVSTISGSLIPRSRRVRLASWHWITTVPIPKNLARGPCMTSMAWIISWLAHRMVFPEYPFRMMTCREVIRYLAQCRRAAATPSRSPAPTTHISQPGSSAYKKINPLEAVQRLKKYSQLNWPQEGYLSHRIRSDSPWSVTSSFKPVVVHEMVLPFKYNKFDTIFTSTWFLRFFWKQTAKGIPFS